MPTPPAGTRSNRAKAAVAAAALAAVTAAVAWSIVSRRASAQAVPSEPPPVQHAADDAAVRLRHDLAAIKTFRPGYAFWQHVFMLPDHSIVYGSAVDGRLLAIFPTHGDWTRKAVWKDETLAHVLDQQPLARRLGERRDQVARLLERAAGPVLHNSTRGDALLPNARRYGSFLAEWGAIYERFGVPANIGLAQVIFESGLNGTRRSNADAVGFCQWLRKNWARLNHFSPGEIQGHNQTTQAPYCAAYLSVLATKYGSFIPALSEHNAGGTNVGRTLVTGEHLGASDVRQKYFLGSRLALDLRALPGRKYESVHRSYGPRSHLYAEMVFGNTFNVRSLTAARSQQAIHAMRTTRAIPLEEIVAQTRLTVDEIRRFNPALIDRVPANATLYLPSYTSAFGEDVAFWRRPASLSYTAVLDDFVRLEPGPERWDDPAFAAVLTGFRRRFSETNTEEGAVMATVLAYVMDQAYTSSRRTLVTEFRSSEQVRQLIESGVRELDSRRATEAATARQ